MMKMPPREKIHEALSAIADNRVIIKDEHAAEVYSSDKTKKYLVEWKDNIYSSNDNATYWQRYPGYPIIAVLMLRGYINYDKEILNHFKDINWKELNSKFKNNYSEAVESVYQQLQTSGVDVNSIDQKVEHIYQSLRKLDISIKRSKVFPPK